MFDSVYIIELYQSHNVHQIIRTFQHSQCTSLGTFSKTCQEGPVIVYGVFKFDIIYYYPVPPFSYIVFYFGRSIRSLNRG